MNVQEVATRVKRTFGDESGVQITDDDIIRWINDAQEEIVIKNEGLMETTALADIIQNQSEYSSPTNLSVLRSLKYNGYKLQQLTLNEFNEYLDGYEAPAMTSIYGAGIPEVFTVWDGNITLFPKPNQSITGGLKIYYIKHPTAVATLADSLSVPLQYHTSIVNYCLQQAYELDEDAQKAALKKSQFDERMMDLNDRNKWIGQEYYPKITTLPEDENYGNYGYWGGYY
ncbi:DUF6682 family protein [Streptomyces sp. NPDC012769]|uniref:phage adaptor protein n=1 Tax=Streptomyces sp. NPDC012769 TaxID=3364848 RepID=UPI0036ABAACC